MVYRRFKENEEYYKASSTNEKRIDAERDIIPFTHAPGLGTEEDGRITMAQLKGEFTDELDERVTNLERDFIACEFLAEKPADATNLKQHILYYWKNNDNGIYKCFFVKQASNGAKFLCEIGGRTLYVGDGKGGKADSTNNTVGLSIDDTGGIITNTLSAKGGQIAGDLKVTGSAEIQKNLKVVGDLEVKGTVTKADEISTESNFIHLREGATSGLADNQYTGLEATKYDGTNNGQLVFDNGGTARVGDKENTQPLATRCEESAMTDGKPVYWDKTNRRLRTESGTVGGTQTPVYIKEGVPTACDKVIMIADDYLKSTTYNGTVNSSNVPDLNGTKGFIIGQNGETEVGTFTARGKTTLKGNTAIGGTLDVTGVATLKGATKVANTLNVTGAATLGNALSVTNGLTAKSTLNVTGKSTLGDVSSSGTVDLTGNVVIANDNGKTLDISNASFKNPVSIAQGGTGATGAGTAFNSLGSGLPAEATDATDSSLFITGTESTGGNTAFKRKSGTYVWNWIKGKISAVLGLTSGSFTGNSATATRLATARQINGTGFDGSTNITTSKWGASRTITIKDSDSTNSATGTNVDGSANITLNLPSAIKASITGNVSGSSGSCTGNSATATRLATARNLKVNLASTNAQSFNGSANADSIGVSGILSAGNGGTGKTSLNDSANAFINSLDTGNAVPLDDDYYVAQSAGGGTTTTTYIRRPIARVWDYVQGKISTVLGLTRTSFAGNSATATKATQDESGNNIKSTYGASISISGQKITLSNKNGTSLGSVTVPSAAVSAGAGISISRTQISNSGVRSISTGSNNGTISVNTGGTSAEVSVKGLGTAAYTAETNYAAASHTHTKSQITDFPSSMPASDVYDWAKAEAKPSYSWSEITSKPAYITGSYDPSSGTLTLAIN